MESVQPGERDDPDTPVVPLRFHPATVPGFADYKATYSHFRILKAKLYISRNVLNVEEYQQLSCRG